ncbi:MAG: cytochrome c oxidase subunit 3 [Betaproteobacteria bacterium]|nr:cytochrome c oxidase subunit 3 [Betaproteobacteria bacterium]
MSIAAMFALVLVGIIGWWLFARQLTAKPWETVQNASDNEYGGAALALAPAKVGLWLLLAVITSFFGLLISAYGMRMELADWRPLAAPNLLWLNTAMLIASSIAFQRTSVAVARENRDGMKAGLLASGFFASAFLAGQLFVWQQLSASGQLPASNAANAFFYLLTGLHGLHLLGGLVVWSKTTAKACGSITKPRELRMSIELCALYWHFLLVVWLILFGLLWSGTSVAGAWRDICSAIGIGP